jgi:hypothetical protein
VDLSLADEGYHTRWPQINPFHKLPHLYGPHMMDQYRGVRLGELSPHVFAVADSAFRFMMSEKVRPLRGSF